MRRENKYGVRDDVRVHKTLCVGPADMVMLQYMYFKNRFRYAACECAYLCFACYMCIYR